MVHTNGAIDGSLSILLLVWMNSIHRRRTIAIFVYHKLCSALYLDVHLAQNVTIRHSDTDRNSCDWSSWSLCRCSYIAPFYFQPLRDQYGSNQGKGRIELKWKYVHLYDSLSYHY